MPKPRPTGCKTETHTFTEHTPHGVVKRESRIPRKHAVPGTLEWEAPHQSPTKSRKS